MASSLTASQTLILQNRTFLSPRNPTTLSIPSPPKHLLLKFSKPRTLSLSLPRKSRVSAASSSTIPNTNSSNNLNPTDSLLIESTRTITAILAVTLKVSQLLAHKLSCFALRLKSVCTSPNPDELAVIQNLQDNLVCTVGPLFFACVSDTPSRSLNTPLTVVAAGMARWLDIYRSVLLVRVLLSWFPNVPWDRQPLSAIRDLCDPFLNLFRNIIPPLFNALDISPLFAFYAMAILSSILTSSTRVY